jgi:hypothetical protein
MAEQGVQRKNLEKDESLLTGLLIIMTVRDRLLSIFSALSPSTSS